MGNINILHVIVRSLHFISAGILIGSMIHNLFAVIPGLKHLGAPKANATNVIITKHFLALMWISLVVLIATGIYASMDIHNKLFPIFQQPAGIILFIKLLLVAAIAVIMLLQGYAYIPGMKKLLSPNTPKNQENDIAMNKASRFCLQLLIVHVSVGIIVIVLSVIIFQLVK